MTDTRPRPLATTDRTKLRRKRERGTFDRDLAYSVLDEALVCHAGFVADHGPVVLPMTYARIDDVLYLHGAAGNALLRNLAQGAPVCVTVTLLDGLVLARSAFHHSMNYRSVVLFGLATRVTDPAEMHAASTALVEHLAPGRSAEVRGPSDEELRATAIVRLPIDEGSAKVRTGPPVEDEDDLGLPVWAGVLPLATVPGLPIADVAPGEDAAPPLPVYLRPHRLSP